MKENRLNKVVLTAVLAWGLCSAWALGQIRPQTPQLLPANTVALLTVPDIQRVLPQLRETNLGRMLQDPALGPWAEELYGWLSQALEQVQKRTGVGAPDLALLFRGELSVALIDRPEQPGLAILIDFAEDKTRVEEILATLEKSATSQGARLSTTQVAGVPVRVLEREAARTERLYYLTLERTLLAASHQDVLENLLVAWLKRHQNAKGQNSAPGAPKVGTSGAGETFSSLGDSASFNSLLAECQKLQKERPLAFWYVDPINLLRSVGQDNPNIQFALVMAPILGLDGISALGGAVSAAIGPLDWFTQTHLLISGPRGGALGLLSFGAGDYSPPRWVPDSSAEYLSLNWRLPDVLEAVRTILDGFRGSGALAAELKRVSSRIGIDIETELVPTLTGRIVLATVIQYPARRDSRTQILGLEVRDEGKAKELLRRVVERLGERVSTENFGQFEYYHMERPRGNEQVYFGVVGSWVLATNQKTVYQLAVSAWEGTVGTLAQTKEFQAIAARIDERVDPLSLGMVRFENSRENMRFLFELAQSEEGRKLLEEAAGRDRGARAIRNLINRRGLPPFSVVEPYLVPQGSVLISDESGLHFLTFSFRENPPSEGQKADK
ncbi:MAG: DUF3352 domain-containing protein [Thermoguttaceae bacterium]|nr:DUF3352 domain-containing protein [Thermoguttaceae bacterium]MDW8078893.1 DUF3352 domain-containing protein [Thermoguttaceae bacterium]